jgi:hypothetical protein
MAATEENSAWSTSSPVEESIYIPSSPDPRSLVWYREFSSIHPELLASRRALLLGPGALLIDFALLDTNVLFVSACFTIR